MVQNFRLYFTFHCSKKAILFFLIIFLFSDFYAQVEEDKLKAALIYNISDYLNWKNENKIDTFILAVYGNASDLNRELEQFSKIKKIKSRPVRFIQMNDLRYAANAHILFLTPSLNYKVEEVFNEIKEKNILLFTDQLGNQLYTMINLQLNPATNKINFSVNKQNLILANFDYKEELLLFGGSEIDIKALYKATQKKLEQESNKVELLSVENREKEKLIKEKEIEISRLTKDISQLNNKIRASLAELNALEDTLKIQKEAYQNEKQKVFLENLRYNSILEKYQNSEFLLKNLTQEIEGRTQKLDVLNKIIEQRELQIKYKNSLISQKEHLLSLRTKYLYILFLLGLALLLVVILVVRAYKLKKKYNIILENKVRERTADLQLANDKLLQHLEEQKKYEEELANRERNYREIFNASSDAIFIHRIQDGSIVDVNKAMLDMYGFSKDETCNLSIKDISVDDDSYNLANANKMINLAVIEGTANFEWHARKKNGEFFWVDVTLTKSNIGGKDRILAVIRDITEKKKIDEELDRYRQNLETLVKSRTEELESANEELKATNNEIFLINQTLDKQKRELEETLEKLKHTQNQLIQNEKLASLGIFTAGIAHEINNPVNYISSASMLLFTIIDNLKVSMEQGKELKIDFEQIEFAKHSIRKGIDRTTAIVSSLRNYSHPSDEHFISYNISNCIHDALIILKGNCSDVDIQEEILENLNIRCLPGRINQVFVNLISNAIQAMNPGRDKIIKIKAFYENPKMVCIEIQDNGKGIDPAIIDKIFDPFFTTKEVGKGTGLGLYIVHGIIEQHQGKITVASEKDKGSLFTIKLPV